MVPRRRHPAAPGGGLIRGRGAIRDFWAPTLGTRIVRADTEVERFEARADLAYLVGSYELESVTADETFLATGRFLMVWQRTPDGWRVAVDMWN